MTRYTKFCLYLNILFIGLNHVNGAMNLSANSIYVVSFQPLTLRCTMDEKPASEIVSFKVNNILTAKMKYFASTSKCFIERLSNGTSIGIGECNDECDCQLDGKSYIWSYNGTVDKETMTFECVALIGTEIAGQTLVVTEANGPGSSLTFNSSSDSLSKILGQECSIVCFAVCTPNCQFQWSKNTSVVSTGTTLHIPKLEKDDYGIYICKAENGYGKNGMKALYLTVNYGPQSVTVLPPHTEYTVIEGTTIPPINCMADCRPVCTYIWSGPNIPADSTNVLSLQNIQKNQTGFFSCTVLNDLGSLKSSEVKIDVQYGPGLRIQFEPSATSVTNHKGDKLGPINCSATCNPPCQYTWTKPDKTTINASLLVVSSLSVKDHGPFICTASNGINGSKNKSLIVTVNYGPQSVKLEPPDTQYFVIEGSTLSPFSCTADCLPVCNYTWSGPHVPIGTTNVLSLQNIQRNQGGVYNCRASNNGGSMKSSDVKLNIQFGPGSSLQFDPSDTLVTKEKGDQFGPIQCEASCNPPCQYTWTKPDRTVITDRKLTIESLSIDDHGTFICTASNAVGGSQNKNLNVTVN